MRFDISLNKNIIKLYLMFIHIDAWYIKEVYKIEDVRRVLNMGFIVMLIVGGLIGWVAGMIMGKDIPGGIIGNIIAGLIGSAV